VLLTAVALLGTAEAPASATHPCAQSTDGSPPYDPAWASDHDACVGQGHGPNEPGDVTVTNADAGATVTVPLGKHLRVRLDAGFGGPVWSEIASGGALFRAYLDVQRPVSGAVFTALRATDGETVTATGPTAWSVTVVVPSQPPASDSPTPTCQQQQVPSSYTGAVAVTEADNGMTIQVSRGDAVGVFFAGCRGFDFLPATATAPLQRYRAHGSNPGGASAVFSTAGATGTATISSITDAPCFHSSPACAAPQQMWQVTIQVVDPCRLTGEASVPVGTDARLTGRFPAGATVRIWFRPYGGTAFAVRRTLTADAGGNVSTSFRSLVDQRWYATTDQSCTTTPGLTQVKPYVVGPASVRRGATVPVVVHGPAGASVGVWFRRAGGDYALRRTGRLDGYGVYKTSYAGDADYSYYAVTGPDRRTTTAVLTTAT
jgi:hypothetical protein